jgi:RIO kinase 2
MIDHAAIFKGLHKNELSILKSIENGMKRYEWVPVEEIERSSKLSKKEIEYRLVNLTRLELIEWLTQFYIGYRLKFNGYDILAINSFVRKDTIDSLGNIIGVGKESIIIAAKMGEKPVCIKFHREGRTSFKQVKRTREHLVNMDNTNWLHASKLAAEREFKVMKELFPAVSIPEPVDHNRHAIVMSVAEGYDLTGVKLVEPEWYLDEILKQIKNAYGLGYIHGDLSEYNVIVSDKGITIIDWPQYVKVGSKTAEDLLRRDLFNILNYFEKKYHIKKDKEQVILGIKSS